MTHISKLLRLLSAGAVGALLLAASSSATAGTGAAQASAGAAVFGPAAYVDYKRFGGEPLVAIDRYPFADGRTRDLVYASSPNGFGYPHYSTFFRSDDVGQTFHEPTHVPVYGATEPNAGGGGDSALAVGAVTHKVFFADLPGPACDTMNVSSDLGEHWTSDALGCGTAPGAIDDRQWVAADETNPGSMNVYMSFDDVTYPNATTLALARSTHDGAPGSFVTDSVCNTLNVNGAQIDNLPTAPAPNGRPTACPDPADPQEAVAGPVIADTSGASPFAHHVYIPFIRDDSNHNWTILLAVSTTGGLTWTRHVVASLGNHEADNLFPVAAVDRGGNVYVVWTQASGDTTDASTLGGETDTYLAVSRTGGSTWSKPVLVAPKGDSTVMPWIVAGDPGRIDVTFYRSNTSLNPNADFVDSNGVECSSGSAGCNANASIWDTYLAQSLDALGGSPRFALTRVTDHPNHIGQICTSGLNCTTGGNRNLLDFFSVDVDHEGAAAVIFADDNNANHIARDKLARQLGGASLFAGASIDLGRSWPVRADGASDPAGDVIDEQGAPVGDAPGMDILDTSVSRAGDKLTVTLKLSGPPTAAAATAASKGLATGGLWGVELWSPSDDFYVAYRDNPTDGAPTVEAGRVDNDNPTLTSTEFDPSQGGTLGGTCLPPGTASGLLGAVDAVVQDPVTAVQSAAQGVLGATQNPVGAAQAAVSSVTSAAAPAVTGPCTITLTTSLSGLGIGGSAPLLSATGLSVYLDGVVGPVTSNSELADATAAFDAGK
jgi:hypothetical protein